MDKKPPSNSNRLDNYIRSNFTVLPFGSTAYSGPNGDKRALCVFCDCLHNNHPVLLWNFTNVSAGEEYKITDTFCCDRCQNAIERISKLESEAEMVNREAIRKNRYKNVGYFVRDGVFPRNSYLHRTHIREDDFLHQSSRFTQCVFCDASLTDGRAQLTKRSLMLPVGIDIYSVDGGTVYACGECMSVIHQTIPELSLDGWLANTFASAECVRCGNSYTTTMEEEEMRSIARTHGQYLCGACACDNLRENGVGPLHTLRQGLNGMYNRYVETHCEFCLEDFSIDQMLSPVYAYNTYVTSSGKIVCRECCLNNEPPFLGVRVGDSVWTFYQEGEELKAANRNVHGSFKQIRTFYTLDKVFEFFNTLEEEHKWR